MISEASHVYAGRELKAGDEFDCEPLHVQLMMVLGRARKLEKQIYRTRDMRARRIKK